VLLTVRVDTGSEVLKNLCARIVRHERDSPLHVSVAPKPCVS
jgi:hypothetical protein